MTPQIVKTSYEVSSESTASAPAVDVKTTSVPLTIAWAWVLPSHLDMMTSVSAGQRRYGGPGRS
jgi:hypothetical protein